MIFELDLFRDYVSGLGTPATVNPLVTINMNTFSTLRRCRWRKKERCTKSECTTGTQSQAGRSKGNPKQETQALLLGKKQEKGKGIWDTSQGKTEQTKTQQKAHCFSN